MWIFHFSHKSSVLLFCVLILSCLFSIFSSLKFHDANRSYFLKTRHLCVWQFGHFHLCGGTVCWLIISWEWTPKLDFEPLISIPLPISKSSYDNMKMMKHNFANFCSKHRKSWKSRFPSFHLSTIFLLRASFQREGKSKPIKLQDFEIFSSFPQKNMLNARK